MLVYVCTTHFPSLINSPKHCTPKRTYVYMYTIDREIFTLKIIHVLNFHVKDISVLDGFQCSSYVQVTN